MISLFKRKKDTLNARSPASRHVSQLNSWTSKQQRRLATLLSRGEQRLTLKQKKVCLFVFCGLMGALSTYWLYQGIKGKSGTPAYMKQRKMVRPADISLPDSLNIHYLEEQRRQRVAAGSIGDSSQNIHP